MKVILLKNVENIGKKFEVKDVKSGYAMNFLIPKNLARPATKEALIWLEMQKEIEAKKSEEDLAKIQELASALDDQEISIFVKTGAKGELYESITAQKIVDKIKEMGFEVKKNQIDLLKPIKETGEFQIKIKLEHNLEAEIKLIVNEEVHE